MVISGRWIGIEDDIEHLELAWLRDRRWKKKVVPRTVIANRTAIVNLAGDGLPVNSNNSSDVVQFLNDFENANLSAMELRGPSGELTGRQKRTNFSNAVLTGARFADTELSKADWTGTILAQERKSQ